MAQDKGEAMLDRLIRQLTVRGLRVEPGSEPDELRLVGNMKEASPAVVEAVKVFKPLLLERIQRRAAG